MTPLQQAWNRVVRHWPWKLVGTTGLMTAFFVSYFWVLHHPQFAVTVMPLTPIDRWLEFRPGAVVLYVSLWLYVSLGPSLLRTKRELAAAAAGWLALGVSGLAIFLIWPTKVPPLMTEIDVPRAFEFLKSVDASGNACPSLHVAFAVLTGVWLHTELTAIGARSWVRWSNWLWCAGIVYSTIAIRQHVVLDVLAGAALAVAVAAVHARCVKTFRRTAAVQTS